MAQTYEELDTSKLTDLLTLKYQTTHDAAAELDDTTLIRETFIYFQKHRHQGTPATA